jgi:hypothetical protein
VLFVSGVSVSCLSGWWRRHGGFSYVVEDSPRYHGNQGNKGFHTQLLPRVETHVGLHLQCPSFVSDLNQNWNVSTNFFTVLHNEIPWKSVWWYTSFYIRRDGRVNKTDLAKQIATFLQLLCDNTNNKIGYMCLNLKHNVSKCVVLYFLYFMWLGIHLLLMQML